MVACFGKNTRSEVGQSYKSSGVQSTRVQVHQLPSCTVNTTNPRHAQNDFSNSSKQSPEYHVIQQGADPLYRCHRYECRQAGLCLYSFSRSPGDPWLTGYIGGAVLQLILQHPQVSTFSITALVRDAAKAALLESKCSPTVKAAVGSLQDLDKLTELAENAHIVVHTVSTTRLTTPAHPADRKEHAAWHAGRCGRRSCAQGHPGWTEEAA